MTLDGVRTPRDFWLWTSGALVPEVYMKNKYNGEAMQPFEKNFLVCCFPSLSLPNMHLAAGNTCFQCVIQCDHEDPVSAFAVGVVGKLQSSHRWHFHAAASRCPVQCRWDLPHRPPPYRFFVLCYPTAQRPTVSWCSVADLLQFGPPLLLQMPARSNINAFIRCASQLKRTA